MAALIFMSTLINHFGDYYYYYYSILEEGSGAFEGGWVLQAGPSTQ